MYLVTAEEMQTMDRLTIERFGIPGRVLMENAGRGATRLLIDMFPDVCRKRIGVVAGRGNNGGDGFVMARYLSEMGAEVIVYLLGTADRVQGDAAANLNLLAPLKVPVIEMPDKRVFSQHRTVLRHCRLWVDAILGTGLKSEVKGYYRDVIEFMNQSRQPIFAVDIPSGLDADTGQPHGVCTRAVGTATFAFAKIGHFMYPGRRYTGRLGVVDIGIPSHILSEVAPRQLLMTRHATQRDWRTRKADAHKGGSGHLLIAAGSRGKGGAAVMTANAAMKMGAGLVTLAIPECVGAIVASKVTEVMTEPLPDTDAGGFSAAALPALSVLLKGRKCLAIGPGLGTDPSTGELLHALLLQADMPVVVDADGLNLLASDLTLLKKRSAPSVLTPHPGEMARLAGVDVKTIQQDRVACARRFANDHNVILVLKGAGTVVALPNGTVFINTTGNSGMASGGMGDVLTGMIAGLIVQGYAPEYAACAAVYLHGAAAEILAEREGAVGYLAGQVADALPAAVRAMQAKAPVGAPVFEQVFDTRSP